MRIFTAAFAAGMLLSTTAHADPKVTWDPRKLNSQVAVGASQNFAIEFSLSETSVDLFLDVVPEISEMVSVAPAHFDVVTAGETVSVLVTVAPAADGEVGFFDGTIRLRADSRTLARPLPVAINVTADPLNATDADADGVWDDVQSWIDANFEAGSEEYFALRQVARALQGAIMNADSEEISLRIANNDIPYAVRCLGYANADTGARDLGALQAELLRLDARTGAYLLFESHLGGHIFRDFKDTGPDQVCENR